MFKKKATQIVSETSIKKSRKFLNRKTAGITGGVLLTTFIGSQLMTAELPKKDDLYGQQYVTVVKHLQEAGFKNIQGVEITDLEFGKIGECDLVELVSVDGEDWKEGRALKNIPITISYHVPKKDAVEFNLPASKNLADVEKELKDSGFKQVELTPVLLVEEGNADKKDKIDRLQIGNHTYQSNHFYSTSLPVTLTYFDVSKDNIKLPKNLAESKTKPELEKQLTTAGFTDIKWTAVADKDKAKHEKIQKISLGGAELQLPTKQEIISKKSTPIVITYYDFSSFAELPSSISTKTAADTKKLFTDGGFSQVSEVATETNEIAKNGQIIAVEIDGKSFNEMNDKVIKKDSKVIIKYWNAEKAIAEKARKEEEERLAAEAKKVAEAEAQSQVQQFAATPSQNTYYPNCKAVRQAGAAPIYRGEPGYGSHLDRDGDGVGCE
ncbi:TPA: excalibur calcium-binding domain-containing protein [Streptococcus suis]|nr:excalibur calcium-binding domain-containing protein [Streptococcus suis]